MQFSISQETEPEYSMRSSSAIRVLFVEDHTETREAISLLLEQSGFDVRTADSYAGALSQAESEQFDVYLLDIRLPDGNGVDLCRTLQWLTPTVPSIYYTAQENMTAELRHRTTQPFLLKPARIEEIERVITETVGR